jgi:periplasmic protein CpxP/Spy
MITKKSGWVLTGVMLMSLAVAAPLALSQSTSTPSGSGKGEHGAFFHGRGHSRGGWEFRQLNLTDDQKAQIKQIRTAHFEATAPVREQMRTIMKGFHESMKTGAFDEAAATQKFTEVAPLRAKLMADSIKMHQEMNAVLTTDQKAKLEQLKQQSATRRSERRAAKTQSSSQE